MIKLVDIFEALEASFRVLFPSLKRVHVERIKKLETPAISMELISYQSPAESPHTVIKQVDIDIIYFSSDNTVLETMRVADRLTNAFSLGLKVKDRYLHVAERPEMKLVEQDLHFLVQYEFADELGNYVIMDDDVISYDPGSTDMENLPVDDLEEVPEDKQEDDIKIKQDKLGLMETLKVDYTLKG